MHSGTFATVINCMDGRTQLPVNEWIRKTYGVDYVDTVTEPGPNKILSQEKDSVYAESIKRRLDISVNHHGSKIIAIVGHYDCAGNPVDEETQKKEIVESVEFVKSLFPEAEVFGLYVDENWMVNKI